MALDQLFGAAGTVGLQRTYLLETRTDNGVPRVLIVFDAITNEVPAYESDVTEVPVEEGPEVTDHIQLKNPRLKLQGNVSQTPLTLQQTVAAVVASGVSLATSSQFRENALNSGVQNLAGVAGASLLGNAAGGDLTQGLADALARAALLDAWQRRARFNVITKRQQFNDMVIQKMSFPRDSNTGDQIVFDLDLKNIKVVSPLTVQLDTVSEDVVTSATGNADLGQQSKSAFDATTEAAADKTFAKSVFDFFRS